MRSKEVSADRHRAGDSGGRGARSNQRDRSRPPGQHGGNTLRLAQYFCTDARCWMNLQDRYDVEIAARDKGDALRAIRPREAA